jgi:tRNA (cmo5U34)-methyltransferase
MSEPSGWASPRAVRRYLNVQAEMVPGRSEAFSLIAALVATSGPPGPRIMDLGCGDGALTARVLEQSPGASATLVDVSDEMLRRARQRFAGDARVAFAKQDLNAGLPDSLGANAFDAIVSCYAIHHVQPENHPRLFRQIRGALRPGGVLLWGDRFQGESPVIASWEMDRWAAWMAERAKDKFGLGRSPAEVLQRQREFDDELGGPYGSIWAARDVLRRAGFTHVDCLYRTYLTAVVVALDR